MPSSNLTLTIHSNESFPPQPNNEPSTFTATQSNNTQQLSRDNAQDIADDLKALWAATSQEKRIDLEMQTLRTKASVSQ